MAARESIEILEIAGTPVEMFAKLDWTDLLNSCTKLCRSLRNCASFSKSVQNCTNLRGIADVPLSEAVLMHIYEWYRYVLLMYICSGGTALTPTFHIFAFVPSKVRMAHE